MRLRTLSAAGVAIASREGYVAGAPSGAARAGEARQMGLLVDILEHDYRHPHVDFACCEVGTTEQCLM
jgi:hypothetical protein